MSEPGIDVRISVANRLEKTVVGVVRASGIAVDHTDEALDRELASVIAERAAGLTDEQERIRIGARDMLRNGMYKPTGRGKPASEYLLRAARDPAAFPRVNWPVDVCNFVSLKFLLPISIWDVDAAQSAEYVFRLGLEGEEYVFNSAGQVIALQDLAVGCAVRASTSTEGDPIVNPIKDGMATKTGPGTVKVAAAIYAPVTAEAVILEAACAEFAEWLGQSAHHGVAAFCLVHPGETRSC